MKFELFPRRPLIGRTQWRWRLVADNGRIVATSGEGYNNKADARWGINLVKGTADVRVVEMARG